ncbi:MAG: 30S ribosomal protein S21 [Desulfuromonadales bacterium]|nr:30S ribosomal protein S21 [Desulfuromonadales bacterium]
MMRRCFMLLGAETAKKTRERGDLPVEIEVRDNNVEKAIKVLKRKLQQEGLFREMKQRKFYEKPSVKRKRKEKEAQRRLRKKQRLMRAH